MKPNPSPDLGIAADDPLPALDPYIVTRIRRALADIGDFGEITLVVLKGRIKFVQVMSSENVGERMGMDD
jgi:hypothetical protein